MKKSLDHLGAESTILYIKGHLAASDHCLFTELENCLEYFDDASHLCRTGHDDVLHTKKRALTLILSPLMFFYAHWCPL